MTVSRMITPKLQISIDHSQSFRSIFNWAEIVSLYPTMFIILKSTKSRISGGKYSGVVTCTSLFTVLKPKLVPKSIILTEQTICFWKSKLISIFSDFKSQWTRLICLSKLRPSSTRLIIFLNYLQLSFSRMWQTRSSCTTSYIRSPLWNVPFVLNNILLNGYPQSSNTSQRSLFSSIAANIRHSDTSPGCPYIMKCGVPSELKNFLFNCSSYIPLRKFVSFYLHFGNYLTATNFPFFWSWQSQTTAQPPLPSTSSFVNPFGCLLYAPYILTSSSDKFSMMDLCKSNLFLVSTT